MAHILTVCDERKMRAPSTTLTAASRLAPSLLRMFVLPPAQPMPAPGAFVRTVDNPFFPLRPGTTLRYAGTEDGERTTDTVTVTRRTKVILGVKAVVVLDVVTTGGKPSEKTFDWYAQDRRGNVWYVGEDSFDRKNGKWVRNDGSWQAGVDGARAGIIMKAKPRVGDTYRQEYYKGNAEDVGRVLSVSRNTIQTRDWSPLEPGVVEHKWYRRGVGEAKSMLVKGGPERQVLVSVRRGK
jgi:hypothetical protein